MVRIADFEKVYDSRHSLAWQWKKEGRKIFSYVYALMPEELLYAADIIPVQLTESEDGEALRKGKMDMPEFFCSYSLSCAGQGTDGVYGYLDGAIFTDACPMIRTVFEVWEEKCAPPFFRFMLIPNQRHEDSIKFYVAQLNDLKERLEAFTGKKITDASLRNAIQVYNENRRLVDRLYETRKGDPPLVRGSEVYEVMKAGLVMPKEEHNRMLQELLDGIINEEPRAATGRPRLMLWSHVFEECSGRIYPNFVRLTEALGGEVVADELHRGSRYANREILDRPDPMQALAERYVEGVPHSWKYPHTLRIQNILESVERFRVAGIIFFVPKYCQTDWFQQYLIEKACKERNIPTLTVETVAGMPEAPVRTRIEAFLEMLSS